MDKPSSLESILTSTAVRSKHAMNASSDPRWHPGHLSRGSLHPRLPPLLANGSPIALLRHDSWFVRMTAVKDRMLEFNAQVRAPIGSRGAVRLLAENVKDWAISERYWGTPLLWRNEHDVRIGSIHELRQGSRRPTHEGSRILPVPMMSICIDPLWMTSCSWIRKGVRCTANLS